MRVRSIVCAALFPAMLPAQNNVRSSFAFFASHYGRWLVAAFEAIPESKYGFSPTPSQQSVGYIAQHLEGANYGLCSRLGRPDPRSAAERRLTDSTKAKWPKDTLVRRLRESLAFCDSVLVRLDDAQIGEIMDFPPDTAMRILPARILLGFTTDLAEHYAQIASYMRQLGLVPPSAVPPKPRVAIDLRVSTLSAYVGKYDLPPSLQGIALMLDVHVRDGALYVTPSGQPEARLWPESPTDFFFHEIDATITFTRSASGFVTGLVVHQNGEDRIARKIE